MDFLNDRINKHAANILKLKSSRESIQSKLEELKKKVPGKATWKETRQKSRIRS